MKHTIKVNGNTNSNKLEVKNLKVGQFAIVNLLGCEEIVTRTYGDVIVSINDPSRTWDGNPSFIVQRFLEPGESFTITVGV